MAVYSHPDFDGHEHVNFFHDPASGLKAIVAIHSTALGFAMGGCRMRAYPTDEDALSDALRLSAAMTRKAAVADLPVGGGKTVIIGDPESDKSRGKLLALGRFIQRLGGVYRTGEDMGMHLEDFRVMAEETNFLDGLEDAEGRATPGEVTAHGCFAAIEAAVSEVLGRDDLSGLKVSIQGLGHVGMTLCKLLIEAGAKVVVADISDARMGEAKALGASITSVDGIYDENVDLFAPCAFGGVVNPQTVPRLKCRLIVGSANNQLSAFSVTELLEERGVVYAPDYVANGGGLIRAAYDAFSQREGKPYDEQAVFDHARRIGDTTRAILHDAGHNGVSTVEIAERMARRRIEAARKGAA